jgi:WD40 repeat protein
LIGHTEPVSRISFSPNGRLIASASSNQTFKVWDAITGLEVFTVKEPAKCVAFCPDGKRIATANMQTIRIWDASTGQEMLTLEQKHTGRILDLTFSREGTRLASCDSNNKMIIWDARPLTPGVRVEREALSVVRFLFYFRNLSKAEVLENIQADRTISEPVREQAHTLAQNWILEQALKRRGD